MGTVSPSVRIGRPTGCHPVACRRGAVRHDLLDDALPADTRRILLRSLGLAFATELCAGICRDSGETALAAWVETAGRLEILVLALPLVRAVADTVAGLLSAG